MASFAYKALDSAGEVVLGNLDAPSRLEALGNLENRGLRPLDLSEGGAALTAPQA